MLCFFLFYYPFHSGRTRLVRTMSRDRETTMNYSPGATRRGKPTPGWVCPSDCPSDWDKKRRLVATRYSSPGYKAHGELVKRIAKTRKGESEKKTVTFQPYEGRR